MVAAQPKRSLGRYDPGRDDYRPHNLGCPPASQDIALTVVAITDPLEPDKRIIAHANRRVDILELERARSTISEGAYQAGRSLQAVWEARNRIGPASMEAGGSSINGEQKASAMHGHLAHTLDSTQAEIAFAERVLGQLDALLLHRILGERKTYPECAILWQKPGDRGTRYIAARFRDALETLAYRKAATGKPAANITAWHV